MRIGIDARMAYYSRAGIGHYIISLIEGLRELKPDEEIVILQSHKDKSNLAGSPFKRAILRTPSHHCLEQWLLPMELWPLRLSLLHSPDFIPPFRFRGLSVITVHDLAFLIYPQILTRESARYYGQIDAAVERADHIIAVSECTKKDLMALLGVPEARITVVYEAADSIYRPIDREEARRKVKELFGLEWPFILFVSTLEPRKNVPTLLKAYRIIKERCPDDIKLVLVGGRGWLSGKIFEMVDELNLQDDVIFLGFVPREKLLYLYNAALVLAHPAIYEGFGLPILEAMACGLPVIASNAASIPEVTGSAALLVDPEDEEALAAAIRRVLREPELASQLREKGLKRAASFSWERTARETLNVYRRVLGES
ncbi:MAG: glycosyltransferase family 1 protein [Chloroflexi bacterium]|nr:MAG: glycosyltransferase family 1 protein [Chloroflexota bacterium]HDN79560.1 glycosyltransferase family 1 protein [Chloroflexota bacterium]